MPDGRRYQDAEPADSHLMYAFAGHPARLAFYYGGRVARALVKKYGGRLATGVAGAAALTGVTSAMVTGRSRSRSRSHSRTGMRLAKRARGRSRTPRPGVNSAEAATRVFRTPGTIVNGVIPRRIRFSGSRSRSAPPVRRGRPPIGVTKSGQDMVVPKTVTFGRMRRLTWKKSLKAVEKYILRFQGMKRYNQGYANRNATTGVIENVSELPGYYSMEYEQVATGGSLMPCHLFALTGIRQATTYSNPHQQMKIQDDGTVDWTLLGGVQADGSTASNSWQLERQMGFTANTAQEVAFARNEWYDIRLCLYGTVKQAVKWTIQYGYFDPLFDPLTIVTGVSAPNDQRDRYNAWWQNQIAAATYHPQLPKPCANVEGIFKTIWRKDYIIQPIGNDEIDGNPNSRMVRFFVRDGRVLKYARKTQRFTSDLTVDNGGWAVAGSVIGDYSTDPLPGARRYLIITANNNGVDTSDGNSSKPSYDLCIRKKVRPIRG